jgi:hypothetical protein
MATFQDLPVELRQSVLEYLVCSFAWLDPPDVDAINPKDWYPEKPAHQIYPVVWHAHRVEPSILVQRLCSVSKAFQADTKRVWLKLVEPRLSPILNVDAVGHGTSTCRSLKGMMVKWLCLPTTFAGINTIEVRIRCFDHPTRSITKRSPRPTGFDKMVIGISMILDRLRNLMLPGLCHRRLADNFSEVKKLRLVYETTLPEGLHWTHSHTLRYKDTGLRLPIAVHPYLTAMEYFTPAKQATMLHEQTKMPLQECEVYMDENIVLSFCRVDKNSAMEKNFAYTVPVDPLWVP